MAPTWGSGDAHCAAMSIGSRPGLFTNLRSARRLALWITGVIGGLALATAGCGPSGATPGGTGAFGAGAGQLPGSCQAVSAKFAECGLPSNTVCPSACVGECTQAASCSELEALFATPAPQGPLVACLQACPGPGGISSGSSSGSSSSTGDCVTDSDCPSGEHCSVDGTCGGSNGGGSGGGGGGGGSDSGSSGSSSSGSASSSSGGLTHPECQAYGETMCSQCDAVDVCDGEDCVTCAATTCDLIYDQCSAWLECQASTCGDCCGMTCSTC
jgi:hypothetical protein